MMSCKGCGAPDDQGCYVGCSEQTMNRSRDELVDLRLRVAQLERENDQLRSLVKLFKLRLDEFMIWFQNTIDGVH